MRPKVRVGATAKRPGQDSLPVNAKLGAVNRKPMPSPWQPWIEPTCARAACLSRAKESLKGTGILVIVPTQGKDHARLNACLASLMAATTEPNLAIVVLVCPNSDQVALEAIAAATGVMRPRLRFLGLPGPFNYPAAMNYVMDTCKGEPHEFVLLLNDDTRWAAGTLDGMVRTLRREGWGCIGPWLRGPDTQDAEHLRMDGPRQLSEPIVGACALWSRAWLDRVGPYDPIFGLGYGHDESDQTQRARRLGMVWGRDESVIVEHALHATIGNTQASVGSEAYQRNVRYWREKWGEIPTWTGSPYWDPLPGVQIVITGHNVAPWLARCLSSVERAMAGFRWVLSLADDESTDETGKIMQEWQTLADAKVFRRFVKATGAGQAKNRVLALATGYRREYPAVVLMDADDVMLPERVTVLLHRAVDTGLPLVHGAWKFMGGTPLDGQLRGPNFDQQRDGWLSPCTTLFHSSLIPDDSLLFREDMETHEDAELFLRWYLDGIVSEPVNALVHEYHVRSGSVMNSGTKAEHLAEWGKVKAGLMSGGPR